MVRWLSSLTWWWLAAWQVLRLSWLHSGCVPPRSPWRWRGRHPSRRPAGPSPPHSEDPHLPRTAPPPPASHPCLLPAPSPGMCGPPYQHRQKEQLSFTSLEKNLIYSISGQERIAPAMSRLSVQVLLSPTQELFKSMNSITTVLFRRREKNLCKWHIKIIKDIGRECCLVVNIQSNSNLCSNIKWPKLPSGN